MALVTDSAGVAAEEEFVPAIPVSAGALIFDRAGRLLILKPTYKTGWTIPGGVMEADGETPWDACRREVLEECGIEVSGGRLACMDFRRPRPGRPGGVRYLFDCGRFSDETLAAVVVQAEEVAEFRLTALSSALGLLRGPIRRRVRAATRGKGLVYLEDGRPVPGVGSLADDQAERVTVRVALDAPRDRLARPGRARSARRSAPRRLRSSDHDDGRQPRTATKISSGVPGPAGRRSQSP
jgi:8-oxo-dGTP diphosphatase